MSQMLNSDTSEDSVEDIEDIPIPAMDHPDQSTEIADEDGSVIKS